MKYFGASDAMDRIHEQMGSNSRIEVSNIRTVKWPLMKCFENCDMKDMKWNGQELCNGDVIYWMNSEGVLFKVKIFVERMDPEESRRATINANNQNALAFQKTKIKSGCSEGSCQISLDQEGF